MPIPLITYSKRTSLVFVGASVAWGLGNDQTQHYTTIIQAAVDAAQSSPKGGSICRNIHSDDIQPGLVNGPYNEMPFNASGGSYTNYGNGTYTVTDYSGLSRSLVNLNPQGGNQGTSPNSAKLNWVNAGAFPAVASAGIFSNYGGYLTPNGLVPAQGPWNAPALRFNASGQNIRFNVNGCTQLGLGVMGTGTVSVFTSWSGSYYWLVTGLGVGGIATQFIPFGWNSTTSFGAGQPVIYSGNVYTSNAGGNVGNTPGVSGWTLVGALGSAPQTVSINYNSGTLDICSIWPGRYQAATDAVVQVIARDSYCLQDYIHADGSLLYDAYSGVSIPALICESVINQPSYTPSAPPIFVLVDSYNSMITGDAGGAGDRRITPGAYATLVQAFAEQILAVSGFGSSKIIITMPVVPAIYAVNAANTGSGGLAWLSGSADGLPGVAPTGAATTGQVINIAGAYKTVLQNMATTNGWYFIDQSQLASLTTSNFFYEGLHPSASVGVPAIANLFISYFTLGGTAYTLAATAGSYTLTGIAVTGKIARKILAATGYYTLTGILATLFKTPAAGGTQYILYAAAGAYALTGKAVTLSVGRVITALVGTYNLTGKAVTLSWGHVMAAAQGSYTLTGEAVNFVVTTGHATILQAATGMYTLTGYAAPMATTRLVQPTLRKAKYVLQLVRQAASSLYK